MPNPRKIISRRQNDRVGWEFRYTDPLTRRRTTRVQWYIDRHKAEKAQSEFIDGREARANNLPDNSGWKLSYETLVERFIAAGEHRSAAARKRKEQTLARNELRVETVANLNNLELLTLRARALVESKTRENAARIPKALPADLRARYELRAEREARYNVHRLQEFLQGMTIWATAARVIPSDPLYGWKKIEKMKAEKLGFTPGELADIFAAADEIDVLYRHKFPLRIAFTTLLLTGNRPGAVLAAKVSDLLITDRRIVLPPGNHKKFNGRAALPAAWVQILQSHHAQRRAGPADPLLCSAGGASARAGSARGDWIDETNLGRLFNQAMYLAFTRQLWPADAPETIEPHEVAYRLYYGRQRGYDGAPPADRKKIDARMMRTQAVEQLAARLRSGIIDKTLGRYLYRLRHTHESLAQAAGVPQGSIDSQTGHSGSGTGDRNYRVPELLDAHRSAEALWTALQEAERRRQEKLTPDAQPHRKAVGAEGHLIDVVSNAVVARSGSPVISSHKPPDPAPIPPMISNQTGSTGLEPATFGVTRQNRDSEGAGVQGHFAGVSCENQRAASGTGGRSGDVGLQGSGIQRGSQSEISTPDAVATTWLDVRKKYGGEACAGKGDLARTGGPGEAIADQAVPEDVLRLAARWESLPENIRAAILLMAGVQK